MAVQSLNIECHNLYRLGKYKECLALAEPSKLDGLPPAEQIEVLLVAAGIKRELTDLASAVDLLERARELAEKNNIAERVIETKLILNTVQAKFAVDKIAAKVFVHESESLLSKVKQMERGKAYDRLYLIALCELGMTKIYAEEIELAAQNLRVASGFATEKYGADSVEMIYPSLCLAIVHAREDKQSLSLVMARNATQIARANFGKHPVLIQPLYRLAQAAIKRELFEMALENCRLVEGKIEEYIGKSSDIYLDVLGMKTAAFMFLVDFSSAEFVASERLRLMEKMRGKDSPKLIDPLCDLAQVLARKGDKEGAEKCFDRALKLVGELGRNNGFPDADGKVSGVKNEEAHQTGTAGTRLSGASLCHLEYALTSQLQDCYMWQGKIADVARLMPASYRYAHTCRVDRIVSIIEAINEHFLERARNLDLPT